MAAAVSQLCVQHGSTLLDCFIQHKGCKVEQISPLFQVQRSIRSVLCQPRMPSTVQISTQSTAVGLCMAKEEKSNFQISSLLFKFIYFKYIYTPEKGYYWQNQPNSLKVKGYQEVNSNVKQLLH